ncbi:MAG: hypothetical protein KAH62_02340 [Desulfobacula sp.]|nr:hypothetical protein [Desulfobacula sp.]
MTDINQINKSAQSLASSDTKISKSKRTDAFETALSKALDKTEAPEMEVMSTNLKGDCFNRSEYH